MKRAEIEDKLAELRLRKAELKKELEDRENLDKGIFLKNNPRPFPLRSSDKIRTELESVADEIDNLETALGPQTQRPAKGELKDRVEKWANEEKLQTGKTVTSGKVEKLVRDLAKEGISTNAGAVRTILSRLGYSKEREDKDAS